VIDRWHERAEPIVRDIRPEFLFCSIDGLPRFGKLAFEQAQIAVFEIDAADVALRLARRGVPLIESFAVGELQAQLELLSAQ
jgi:glycerophosphoryl diester phosphodiesterase